VKMGMRRGFVAVGVLAALAFSSLPAMAQGSNLEISVCIPSSNSTFNRTPNIDNESFHLTGVNWTLEGPDVGGTHGLLITDTRNRKTMSNASPSWGGRSVATEDIEELEWLDTNQDGVKQNPEKLVEISHNYYAQVANGPGSGTVCYFGEAVDIYGTDGTTILPGPEGHAGSWSVDDPDHPEFQPGIFMPADPKPGQHYSEESAGEIAADQATNTGVGTVAVPYGSFDNAFRVKEFSSNEKHSTEYKSYAPNGVGLLIDDTLQRCVPATTGPRSCSVAAAGTR
jgi:hypothetical protein